MITVAEAIAASGLVFLAASVLSAYLADAVGFAIHPFLFLAIAAAAVAGLTALVRRRVTTDGPQLAAFTGVFAATLAWLLWVGRPSELPQGGAPDLTHHLLLIEYIERHWRLIHDGVLGGYLGEMIAYTPGSHLLFAMAGAWSRTNGFRATYPMLAVTVALKCAIVFLIAWRLLPEGPRRLWLSITAAALLFMPRGYVFGSFLDRSFLAQVVSELFAIGAWGALIVWADTVTPGAAIVVGLLSAAVFLSWPVWIGPLVIVGAITILLNRGRAGTQAGPYWKAMHASMAIAPPAIVALIHASRHLQAAVIATVPGYVLRPSVALFGWPFLLVALAGMAAAAMRPRSRTVVWLLAAIALQSATLFTVAYTRDSPYLAFKMMYLAIYPMAVAGAFAIDALLRRAQDSKVAQGFSPAFAVILVALAVRSAATMPRAKAIVSLPLSDAGYWARANVPPACVDYLVADSDTGYWLHLARLGNARTAPRTIDPETFVTAKAIERWILPGGAPYAIAEDFAALPRDIRDHVDVLARFGPAAVVKRRGPSVCAQ